jgi:hypothetical protein
MRIGVNPVALATVHVPISCQPVVTPEPSSAYRYSFFAPENDDEKVTGTWTVICVPAVLTVAPAPEIEHCELLALPPLPGANPSRHLSLSFSARYNRFEAGS